MVPSCIFRVVYDGQEINSGNLKLVVNFKKKIACHIDLDNFEKKIIYRKCFALQWSTLEGLAVCLSEFKHQI
jgi:hypothetical protein